MNFFLYGVIAEDNFGAPSIMHGVGQVIRELNSDAKITCFQKTKVRPNAVDDMPFPVRQIPYQSLGKLFADAVRVKIGFKIRDPECKLFWGEFLQSDVVVNLYGICFCSNLTRIDASNFQAIKSVIATFCMNAIGYMFGKKNVKTTCSYGPIKTKRNLIEARFAAKHIFDVMCAREYESARQMTEVAGVKKEIFVAPDIANLMPFQQKKNSDVRTIGISISHQIIRQWQATESYLECMVKLILHILTLTDCNILLIPNEVVDKAKYNDSHVADDILKRLESNNRRVSILNVAELNSSTIKSEIAACEVMIASRYHSCVAALSAGVPTLVIGWHYKYDELLKFYGQEKWIISNENCNSNLLIEKFDDFWQQRNVSKSEIAKKYPEVRARVLESGRRMFMK